MSVVLLGSTSGSITLQEPAIAGTTVLDLPNTSGTLVVAGGAQTVQFGAGSAAAPSVTFTGDTNTGIFSPGADSIAFSEGGVEAMRLDSSGNMGIGTTNPSDRLVVRGAVSVYGDERRLVQLVDTTALAAGVGAGIAFYGVSESGGGTSQFGSIKGIKENSTSANYAGVLAFVTSNSSNVQTERMRITSTGKVNINQTAFVGWGNPNLAVKQSAAAAYTGIVVESSTNGNGTYMGHTGSVGVVGSSFDTGSFTPLTFETSGAERMRIDSAGEVLIGKTSTASSVAGIRLNPLGTAVISRNDELLFCNRLTTDGALVQFQQDGTSEGNISVSGTTVSYNGGHLSRWSQLPDGSKDDTILKGTVLTNLDDMCVWTKDGTVLDNEQLNKMKVSDVEGDTNVAGVFVNWTFDEQCQSDDMNVAMTGDMIIRIAEGVVVAKGDLLMSAGDGTAKPQGDDIVRSKTIAKVTSNHVTCTYADGSYCVPCVLMAC